MWVSCGSRFLNKFDGLKEGISSVACVRLGWCDRVKGVGNAVWKWVSRLNSKPIRGVGYWEILMGLFSFGSWESCICMRRMAFVSCPVM